MGVFQLRKNVATATEEVTWKDYDVGLEDKLADLIRRVHTGTYRAQPSCRKYILNADGKQRPHGIATL